jgi:predicted nucleotidyltransferase
MLRDRDDLLGHRQANPPEPGSADRNQEGRNRFDAPGEVGEALFHQVPSRQGAQVQSHDAKEYTGQAAGTHGHAVDCSRVATMCATELSPREYHARRDQGRRAEREALRLEVLERARAAIRQRAPEFPAIRAAYLFGSILRPGLFHAQSDVDVAIDCDELESETPFWRALEIALERNVDLLPREGRIAQAVEDYGELVYEREARPS